MRGPARDLGRFYESLLGFGPPLLEPRTVELMGAVHRHELRDVVFGFAAPWGLGVTVDLSGGAGRRAFGHGGMASSRGFADPDCGLVVVFVCNGLAQSAGRGAAPGRHHRRGVHRARRRRPRASGAPA